ncbi:hypothetical protein [Bacillus sp. WP8]|uniref:hypothetical protein n=1 Tax=Bacillus sp. WP8 TaxID=756828 RepID=UPI0016429DA7|nr:hypothetical protein [Bacillus sp. WP8]
MKEKRMIKKDKRMICVVRLRMLEGVGWDIVCGEGGFYVRWKGERIEIWRKKRLGFFG